MSAETIFYIGGGLLVVGALLVSYIGIRGKDSFPPGRGAMTAGIGVFAVLVAGTAAFAVASARDEQEHRESEQAEEEAEAGEEVAAEGEPPAEGGAPAEGKAPAEGQPAGGPAITLDVTSPDDGSLDFEPPRLSAIPGTITLAYDNPSVVTHNIYLQDAEEAVLAESEDVAGGAVEISAELPPGEYFYYCDIPGHREGGMEGTLTVQ